MKNKLLVSDHILDENEMAQTLDFFKDLTDGKYVWINKDEDVAFPLEKIISFAATVFDLSSMVGCECWSHVNTKSKRHVDVDDELWEKTGEVRYPLCSIVYYPYVKDLLGGEFVTKSFQVKPITNRLIVFSQGITHEVENFTGERTACAINPWSYKK